MAKKKKRYMCVRECYYQHPKDNIRPVHYMAEQTQTFSTKPDSALWQPVTDVEIDFMTSPPALLSVSSEWDVVEAATFLATAGFEIDVENPPPREKLIMMITEARTRLDAQAMVDARSPKAQAAE